MGGGYLNLLLLCHRTRSFVSLSGCYLRQKIFFEGSKLAIRISKNPIDLGLWEGNPNGHAGRHIPSLPAHSPAQNGGREAGKVNK